MDSSTQLPASRTVVRRSCSRFVAAFCLWGLSAGGVLWAKPVHPLVRQLGDPQFERRVAAEQEILHQGAAALEWIEAGLQSDDWEIRQRSLRLLKILREFSLINQLERVREDPWTVSEELAPAWEVFHSFTGDSEAARTLYVRMIEQEGELMLAVGLQPHHWMEHFERRCADLRIHLMDRRNSQDLHPMTVLTLLFLAEHPENKLNLASSQTITNLLVDPAFYNYVQNCPAEEAKVCRALLSEWVQRSGQITPPSRLELSTRYQLPAGAAAAREILANRHAVGASRTQLQNAIRFLTIYETQASLQDLEPLLSLSDVTLPSMNPPRLSRRDADGTSPQNTTQETQASDLALLGLVQMTGQDPQSYGFANVRIDLDHRYNTNVPLITSEIDRHQALLRWSSWRAAHPMWFRSAPTDASEGTPL